jgi:hypothetical protein
MPTLDRRQYRSATLSTKTDPEPVQIRKSDRVKFAAQPGRFDGDGADAPSSLDHILRPRVRIAHRPQR